MSRIKALTAEQRELLFQRHSEWLKVGFDTKPADRVMAENIITTMYGLINLPRPLFTWTDSPATAILAIHVLKTAKDGASLGASLRASPYWGQYEFSWIAFYLFCSEIGVWYKPESKETLNLWSNLSRSMGWCFPYLNRRGVARNDELIEFDIGGNRMRGLHLFWLEKTGEEKETMIPVWRTKEQFGGDCPENINDCEQIRRWVMRLPQNAEIVEEV